jgi:hypothetical protein
MGILCERNEDIMIEISDMYFAATLLAYGAELEDIDHTNPHRKKFRFSEGIVEIWVLAGHSILRIENPQFDVLEKHFLGSTLVFPPRFIDDVKKVKSAIHGV